MMTTSSVTPLLWLLEGNPDLSFEVSDVDDADVVAGGHNHAIGVRGGHISRPPAAAEA